MFRDALLRIVSSSRFWTLASMAGSLFLLSGCQTIVAVNSSSSSVILEVASLSGEEGKPLTSWYESGEIGLNAGETDIGKFAVLPYSLSGPGNEYALLRFDAGNGRVERAFVPFSSTCTATVTAENFLDVTISPIPDDRQLVEELTARLPGLQQALLINDTHEVANILLNWAANNVDDAMLAADSKLSTPVVTGKNVAFAYHELFRRDKGAVFCGGFAVFYQKLLLAFDIDALVIDFGDTVSGLTHMSVVLPEQDLLGNWVFYQFDPKLNFRCADATSGQLIGLFDVMDRELANNFNTVQILQGNNDLRDFVGAAANQSSKGYKLDRIKGSRYVFHRVGYTLQAHVTDYANKFVGGGFTPGIAGFFELMQEKFFTVRRGNN